MIKINLFKPEKKEVAALAETASYVEEIKAKKVSLSAVLLAVAISVGVIGGLFFWQTTRLSSERKLLQERQIRKAELEKVLAKLAEVEKTKAMLENKIKVINDLKVRQKDAVLVMDKLSRSLPDWVWLTSLSFSNQVLTLNGKALSNNLIADFINNLQNSNYFLNVQLRTSVRKREAGTDIFEFRLDCQFNRLAEANKAG